MPEEPVDDGKLLEEFAREARSTAPQPQSEDEHRRLAETMAWLDATREASRARDARTAAQEHREQRRLVAICLPFLAAIVVAIVLIGDAIRSHFRSPPAPPAGHQSRPADPSSPVPAQRSNPVPNDGSHEPPGTGVR